jgi:SPP1 family predicted phage head-tail adaptor
MSLGAGRLRHRVRIERPVEGRDANGLRTGPTWELVARVWAEVRPLSARDFAAAEAPGSKVVARITIRARTDVDATMRVVHGQAVYAITGVLPDPDSGREYMTLPVTAGVSRG